MLNSTNLSPSHVSSIKSRHSNFKVALSLGVGSVVSGYAYFNPSSTDSWESNSVSSLTHIIKQFNLDGIDIDYEHFKATPGAFAECIGRLITTLKKNRIIKFASIAPFDDDQVQSHYKSLWKSNGHLVDYVNFQFYAYDQGTTVSQRPKSRQQLHRGIFGPFTQWAIREPLSNGPPKRHIFVWAERSSHVIEIGGLEAHLECEVFVNEKIRT
ncbi:Chitinase 1 [Tripterygium wilfordii]|uniref:Chitinase 1 n=1 Tax=Tripterygium wilfordii TaxID=458696 RepID=A0A7J7DE53_TRIWF|nr:Chitinase 1 [Tripterygium wilfordii]